jgi:hypothetical protein
MWPLKQSNNQSLSAFEIAVKAGKLIDMQKKPYKEFNEFLKFTPPTGITPAAFKEFIDIPREKGHRHIQKAARWAILLMEAHRHVDPWHDDPTKEDVFDTTFEIQVTKLSGFHQFKKIRIRKEQCDGTGAVIFMLPTEEYPLPS